MRPAISILGTEVFAVEFGTPEADDVDDPGSFTLYPVGFARDPDPIWEDQGSRRQFDE